MKISKDINMQYLLRILRNRYLLFFTGILLIILVSKTVKIDKNIANKSHGYFVLQNIEQANEAGRLGYIKYEVNDYATTFGLDWNPPKNGVRRIIRSGPEDFDDIGYISLLQLIAIAGKKITITFVEKLHNYAFIISAGILSFIIAKFYKNIFAGWIFMILVLLLKSRILSLIYGSPDSRTFVVFFPMITIGIIIGLNWLRNYSNSLWRLFFILLFGVLVGMMALIRSSEGMAALYAVLFSIIILRAGIKQKTIMITALVVGYFLITIIMPIAFALHRDIKTGEFGGEVSPYLQTTGKHQAWHSIVLGIGKYPNSINLRYDDITVYNILRSKYPDAMDIVHNFHGKGYYAGLQGIYFDYITNYPLEYFKNLAKSYRELFYFIPYATSVGNSTRWRYGYLPLKPGISAGDWDMPLRLQSREENVLALKYRYLKLNPIEWGIFILSIIFIIFAIRLSFNNIYEKDNKSIFLSFGFYIFMLATQRAIIPQHGLSLIAGFWIFAIMSLLYIFFTNNAVRAFLFLRLRSFNV